MMRGCDACGEWAQWRLIYKEKDGSSTTRLLCTQDKNKELAALPEELRPKVAFIGAAIHGPAGP